MSSRPFSHHFSLLDICDKPVVSADARRVSHFFHIIKVSLFYKMVTFLSFPLNAPSSFSSHTSHRFHTFFYILLYDPCFSRSVRQYDYSDLLKLYLVLTLKFLMASNDLFFSNIRSFVMDIPFFIFFVGLLSSLIGLLRRPSRFTRSTVKSLILTVMSIGFANAFIILSVDFQNE